MLMPFHYRTQGEFASNQNNNVKSKLTFGSLEDVCQFID